MSAGFCVTFRKIHFDESYEILCKYLFMDFSRKNVNKCYFSGPAKDS